MASLSDKLKSLGVKVGTAEVQSKKHPELENVFGGRWLNTQRGQVLIVEQRHSAEARHGQTPIRPTASFANLAAWAGDDRLGQLDLSQFAFLDTETSGLSGGTGTYAFMVGAGRFVDGEFRLALFFMPDPADEPALLEALAEFLAPCASLVTFNGKAFDAPLLRTRYALNQIPCPFDGFSHLDLLPLARRLWRDRLPSRALKYLEEHILLAPRTTEEVPGYEIPWLYFDFLRTGQAEPLKGVFYHNAMDVIAMAALLNQVSAMLADPHHFDLEHGLDLIALARLFEDLHHWEDAALLYERGLKTNLPEADFGKALQRLSALQRRRGNLATAVRLWEQAAGEGHIFAHVELAKYHEHHGQDPATALAWTLNAARLVAAADLPVYIRRHWIDELLHRQGRLEAKLSKPNAAA